jgi:hypothetical protein
MIIEIHKWNIVDALGQVPDGRDGHSGIHLA